MVSVRNILLAPINGAVYVIKLPFLLIWMLVGGLCTCIYGVLCAIVSFPVNCVRRLCNRIKLLWAWSKTFARQCLPWKTSSTAIAIGTQTFVYSEESEDHELQALPPPPERGIYTSHSSAFRKRRGSGRRQSRKKLVSFLIKVLMEPNSPSDSGEENERAMGSPDTDEGERALQLITDLLKLSRSDGTKSPTTKRTIQRQDLEALKQRAKDKELLQALIVELDQLDVDPATLLHRTKRKKKSPQVSPVHTASLSPDQELEQQEEEDVDDDEFDENGSVSSCGEITPDLISEGSELIEETRRNYHGGLSPVQESPEYQTGSPESMNYTQLESDLNSALSVLQTEMKELQADQEVVEKFETQITQTVMETWEENTTAGAGGANGGGGSSDASFEDAQEEFASVPKVSPTLGLKSGHDRRELAAARKTRPPTRKTNFQYPVQPPTDDNADKDNRATHNEPAEEGGDYVSDSDDDDEEHYSSCSEDNSEGSEFMNEPELERSSDGDGVKLAKRMPPGAVQVLPPLSDQFQLLSPKSQQVSMSYDDTTDTPNNTLSPTTNELYTKVEKKKKKPDTLITSKDHDDSTAPPLPLRDDDLSPAIPRRRAGSSVSGSSDVDGETEKKSWMIQSSKPPWLEMVERTRTNSSDKSTPGTPTDPPKSLSTPDAPVLPRKSSLSNPSPPVPAPNTNTLTMDESYDVLPPKKLFKPPVSQRVYREDIYETIPSQHQYLHEVVAAQQQQQEVSQAKPPGGSRRSSLTEPSPPLPPRNPNNKIKRALSLGSVDQEDHMRQEKERHKSERMSASPRESRSRDKHRSESSSSRKHHHSHSSSDREGESKSRHSHHSSSSSDRHRHHHRHGSRSRERSDERESRSKHHDSRDSHHHHHHHHHRSTSGDRSGSRERHRSSSSRHRSHSSERRHQHSTDHGRDRSDSRERSSRHSTSSDHHRSRSSTKRSQDSSTSPKSSKESVSPWKLFISPALSRKSKESSSKASSEKKSPSDSGGKKSSSSKSSSKKKSKSSETPPSSSSSRRGSKSSPPKDSISKSTSASSLRSSIGSTGSRESVV